MIAFALVFSFLWWVGTLIFAFWWAERRYQDGYDDGYRDARRAIDRSRSPRSLP